MLYQLSYASKTELRLCGRKYVSDPFQMSGTIFDDTTTASYVQGGKGFVCNGVRTTRIQPNPCPSGCYHS
jgi:hypothetical protein